MKKKLTLMIAALATAGIVTWAHHATAQTGPEEGHGASFAAFFMGDASPDDEQFRGRRGPKGPRGEMRGGIPAEMMEQLELTDNQKSTLKNLRNSFAKDMARLRADAEVAQIELREVMDDTSPSVSDARSRAARVNEARSKIFERTVTFRVEAKNVLTPEQQKTLQEEGRQMLRGRRSGAMRGPRGGRGFRGPRMRHQELRSETQSETQEQ